MKKIIFVTLLAFCLLSLMVFSLEEEVDTLGTPNITDSSMETTINEMAESIKEKAKIFTGESKNNSETVNNLSITVLVVTAIILAITVLVLIFSIASPIFLVYYNNKLKQELKQGLERDMRELRNEEIKEIKETVRKDLKTEFETNIIGVLEGKVKDKVDYYEKIVEWQIKDKIGKQSIRHGELLYLIEKVRLDMVKQPKDDTSDSLYQWIKKQQKNYVALLQIISPEEAETYNGLGGFRERNDLPPSFLDFLRFLKKSDPERLSGRNMRIARDIARKKFGEELEESLSDKG